MEELRCVDEKTLKTIVPFSRAHRWRLETQEKYHHGDPFPARVRISPCRVCWMLHEVYAWLERQMNRR